MSQIFQLGQEFCVCFTQNYTLAQSPVTNQYTMEQDASTGSQVRVLFPFAIRDHIIFFFYQASFVVKSSLGPIETDRARAWVF